MPDLNTIQPIVAIIAPFITAAGGALVTYFLVAKRKMVTFWLTETEDVTLPLRRHHKDISFRVGGREFLNLNKAELFVKNTGNMSIARFQFDIEIPESHQQYLAEIVVDDAELRNAIKISLDEPRATINPRLHISVDPFFNGSESFGVLVYSDGVTRRCKIHCRVEDVKTRIKNGAYVSFTDALMGFRRSLSLGAISALIAGLMAFFAGLVGSAHLAYSQISEILKSLLDRHP